MEFQNVFLSDSHSMEVTWSQYFILIQSWNILHTSHTMTLVTGIYSLRSWLMVCSCNYIAINGRKIRKQPRQCTYKQNIGAFYVWKCSKYFIFWVCVCVCSLCYLASNAHALYYNVICGLSGSTIFFHIIT